MSFILGIDSSGSTLSVAISDNKNPIVSINRFVKNAHSENIMQLVKEVVSLANISISEIERAAIVVGPGSFTGLRIGIAFLKGLFADGKEKVFPVSTLENMAYSFPTNNKNIISIIDARQDNYFYGKFNRNNNNFIRLEDDIKLSREELISKLNENDIILYDKSGNMRSTLLEDIELLNPINIENFNLNTALSASLLAAQNLESDIWDSAINIFPNYMQESYAQRIKK